MKKILKLVLSVIVVVFAYAAYVNLSKILPFYDQLTKDRVRTEINLQSKEQSTATYVGSQKCSKCHEENHKSWSHSRHPKMIQDFKADPSVLVADFSKLPKDANFKLEDATYTVGGKFKQRFMIRKDVDNKEDYVLGNYQWNVETKKWQSYKSWKYWYKDAYPHENEQHPTSRACDGCHFTGFMSREIRVETGIACEACHGPASLHVENPESQIYKASLSDPGRQNEVCLQCHMRNRDIRMKDKNMSEIYGDARDYPLGYEPGKALSEFKYVAPFILGQETKEFYANGVGKKNRMQGNEFVHSMKGKHGITCINCHNPHTLEPTAQKNTGNDLCMNCHSFGSLIGPHQSSLTAHTRHKEESKGSLCVECHMPKVGKHTSKSPHTVRTHVFGFITPKETRDFKMPKETNACFSCHKDKTLDSLQKDMEKWGMIGWDKR
ncbi:multiheme c-type cytochrome [Sulfurimonas sp.]|nr:multiheme c-type cytochrome [Sulfurimonas sp.]